MNRQDWMSSTITENSMNLSLSNQSWKYSLLRNSLDFPIPQAQVYIYDDKDRIYINFFIEGYDIFKLLLEYTEPSIILESSAIITDSYGMTLT